ncbi:O-antigen ligase family protein [Alkalibacillus aidingensis]|uniref:O-antigen ligase family protein n=1 Tax=Alkalibacillus aidingensis TaxID=2747607 RepID=UPI001660F6AE|nr:O-antigen ligase family protein [Alkalibacillus aidingensis]
MNFKHSFTYYVIVLHLLLIPLVPLKVYLGPLPLSAEVVLIPLLVLAFLWDYKNKQITINKEAPIKMFAILFGLYFLVQIISLTQAEALTPAAMEMARYLSYAFLFLIVLAVSFTKREYVTFAITFFIAMTIMTTYGVLQFAFDWNLNKAGLYALIDAHGRVQSFTNNPNYWAGLINFVLPIVLLLSVVWAKDKRLQLGLFALFSLLVVNQIFTYTRSAWVIMVLAILMAFLFLPRKFFKKAIKVHILIPIILLTVVVYNLPDVEERTRSSVFVIQSFIPDSVTQGALGGGVADPEEEEKTEEDRFTEGMGTAAVASRTTLWKTGLTMYQENPVLGVGVGNYSTNYKDIVTRYPNLYVGHDTYSVHNSFIKVMAETGTIGIIAFLAIYIYYYLYIGELYLRNRQDLTSQVLLIGLFIGSGTFMGQNLANNLVFIPQINVIFWLVSALLLSYIINRNNQKTAN